MTHVSDLFLSLTVQRFNAVAFRGCFADERGQSSICFQFLALGIFTTVGANK